MVDPDHLATLVVQLDLGTLVVVELISYLVLTTVLLITLYFLLVQAE
jgi:hypothetical protein